MVDVSHGDDIAAPQRIRRYQWGKCVTRRSRYARYIWRLNERTIVVRSTYARPKWLSESEFLYLNAKIQQRISGGTGFGQARATMIQMICHARRLQVNAAVKNGAKCRAGDEDGELYELPIWDTRMLNLSLELHWRCRPFRCGCSVRAHLQKSN